MANICPFCKKKIELSQRLKIFSQFRNVCKKCERGVKVGVIIGALLFEESKKPKTIIQMGKSKIIGGRGKKIRIRRGK